MPTEGRKFKMSFMSSVGSNSSEVAKDQIRRQEVSFSESEMVYRYVLETESVKHDLICL